ncbi:MAG TPA: rhodanese-like domain-containing protein [Panacibacter sp.]|nr:rhodanese-like domain-containing protein [Panacibacter sp.]
MEVEELQRENISFKLIDIRTADEFNKLHIPIAENIDATDLESKLSAFSKNDIIVCVCNKGHERSQSAAAFFYNNGFENTFYLQGGTLGWFAE